MRYNLTDNQKLWAKHFVNWVRDHTLRETFHVTWISGGGTLTGINNSMKCPDLTRGILDALTTSNLLISTRNFRNESEHSRGCTLTGLIYHAVDTNFAEEESKPVVSSLARPFPPEIAISLNRLRQEYPNQDKFGFLMMRFATAKPYARIVDVIKSTTQTKGLTVRRADDHDFHSQLWENVLTYLHGCSFGIAVYERIEDEEPNANVGLEVGYLLALGKPVLLLKDETLPNIQTDLTSKLYKRFSIHEPEKSLPQVIEKWLIDWGIVVSKP